eukprot:5272659-Prymnesium_polylepis.1
MEVVARAEVAMVVVVLVVENMAVVDSEAVVMVEVRAVTGVVGMGARAVLLVVDLGKRAAETRAHP